MNVIAQKYSAIGYIAISEVHSSVGLGAAFTAWKGSVMCTKGEQTGTSGGVCIFTNGNEQKMIGKSRRRVSIGFI